MIKIKSVRRLSLTFEGEFAWPAVSMFVLCEHMIDWYFVAGFAMFAMDSRNSHYHSSIQRQKLIKNEWKK